MSERHALPGEVQSLGASVDGASAADLGTNWRGQPLVSLAVIVNLIGSTRTAAGLRVRCELDRGAYPKGQDVTDSEMATLNFVPHRFHGDWNYTIHPRRGRK